MVIPALILKVKRKTGTNVLEMTEQVRDRTKEYTANWPENISVNFSFDQSSHVFNMINSLQSSIVNAIVLVMLIVIGALGFSVRNDGWYRNPNKLYDEFCSA